MWQVDNSTPFTAAGNWVRDRDGAELWQVAVRAVFDVHSDGTTSIAPAQQPPVLAPVFYGDPSTSGLKYDSDFLLTKPTTDVVLHGHAYSPDHRPAPHVEVSMRVGPVEKRLRVTGDRIYERRLAGLAASEPEPFVRMPIAYERAFGGWQQGSTSRDERPSFEVRNPVGVGFEAKAGTPVPNVEYVTGSKGRPAGFGPVPVHWHPRLAYAGTYEDEWRRTRLPLYPDDLDDRFFLCSPEDQRPPQFLRGGEPVVLVNVNAEGVVRFVLPRLAFRFETVFRERRSIVHRGSLHTVILEPDDSRLVMVWQTSVRAHADVHRLMHTRIRQLRVLNPVDGSVPAASHGGS